MTHPIHASSSRKPLAVIILDAVVVPLWWIFRWLFGHPTGRVSA